MTFKQKLNEVIIFVDDNHFGRNKTEGYHNTAKITSRLEAFFIAISELDHNLWSALNF